MTLLNLATVPLQTLTDTEGEIIPKVVSALSVVYILYNNGRVALFTE